MMNTFDFEYIGYGDQYFVDFDDNGSVKHEFEFVDDAVKQHGNSFEHFVDLDHVEFVEHCQAVADQIVCTNK